MRLNRLTAVLALVVDALIVGTAARLRAQSEKALLLFGDKDHKTFLGCLIPRDEARVAGTRERNPTLASV